MPPSPPTEEGIDFLRGGGGELSSWLPRVFSTPKKTDTTKEEEQDEET